MTNMLSHIIFLALAQMTAPELPDTRLIPFVPAGEQVLAIESADLNGDGALDYLLITEEGVGDEESDGRRSLFVITGSREGSLKVAARNDRVVFCRRCGGVFGDPFAEASAARKSFTVRHYGGSNSRWTFDATFAYSRQDKAWQLVKVEESSFHTSEPTEEERHVYVPPRDFGKIDLVDFDPNDFRGKGEK